jgi:hypothetical protein
LWYVRGNRDGRAEFRAFDEQPRKKLTLKVQQLVHAR